MVNKLTIEDKNLFNELGLLVNNNFINVFNLEDILNSEYDYLFGYYDNNKLIGFIHLNKLYENMDIVNIVVNPEYRKQGIGTKLLDYSVRLFDDIKTILLEVNENNVGAIEFYKKFNFEIINVRNNYYGSDAALIMKRDV